MTDGTLRLIDSLLKEKAAAHDRCDFELEAEIALEIQKVKQEARRVGEQVD